MWGTRRAAIVARRLPGVHMSHRSIIPRFARVVAAAAASVALVSTAACLRDKSHDRAAAEAVDTASPAASATNFTKFLAAAESGGAVERWSGGAPLYRFRF